ncbi:hypothetical protein EDB92DRAFT_1816017 [Lactarius akahatsu]|uniref:Uncharacterized protein n=1 Tax=Lactarius akahatsu TaxID=416441 RepID=A0AAD4LG65_9AGAM|nr:hypothetical protein EDB92DRAFT_1816017 [Lactarius akahatsu]
MHHGDDCALRDRRAEGTTYMCNKGWFRIGFITTIWEMQSPDLDQRYKAKIPGDANGESSWRDGQVNFPGWRGPEGCGTKPQRPALKGEGSPWSDKPTSFIIHHCIIHHASWRATVPASCQRVVHLDSETEFSCGISELEINWFSLNFGRLLSELVLCRTISPSAPNIPGVSRRPTQCNRARGSRSGDGLPRVPTSSFKSDFRVRLSQAQVPMAGSFACTTRAVIICADREAGAWFIGSPYGIA